MADGPGPIYFQRIRYVWRSWANSLPADQIWLKVQGPFSSSGSDMADSSGPILFQLIRYVWRSRAHSLPGNDLRWLKVQRPLPYCRPEMKGVPGPILFQLIRYGWWSRAHPCLSAYCTGIRGIGQKKGVCIIHFPFFPSSITAICIKVFSLKEPFPHISALIYERLLHRSP